MFCYLQLKASQQMARVLSIYNIRLSYVSMCIFKINIELQSD